MTPTAIDDVCKGDGLMQDFELRKERDECRLAEILESYPDSHNIDPDTLPSETWGLVAWDFMDPEDRDKILAGMFRQTLKRAKATMPIYAQSRAYGDVYPGSFESMDQLVELPVLVKDGEEGFRQKVRKNPLLLKPTDKSVLMTPYLSGGTGIDSETVGKSTPTWITEQDLERESLALALRCFIPGGLSKKMKFMNLYNLAHKGGEEIRRAVTHLDAEVFLPRRPEDSIDHCLEYMSVFGITAIAAVPQSPKDSKSAPKGGAISFEELYARKAELFGSKGTVKNAFVTGFAIPESVIRLADRNSLRLFTTWGSSEAIPGATSTVLGPSTRLCKYNNQHVLPFPHYLSVVEMSKQPRLCKPGEQGLLLLTTIARDGTLFVNYAIGDRATVVAYTCDCGRTTPVIGKIHRGDNLAELAGGGCRYA